MYQYYFFSFFFSCECEIEREREINRFSQDREREKARLFDNHLQQSNRFLNMFPLTRVVYMPFSPSTTYLQPISTDCSTSSTIPLYNPPIFNQQSFPISNCECSLSNERMNIDKRHVSLMICCHIQLLSNVGKCQRELNLFLVEQSFLPRSKRIPPRKRWKFNDSNRTALMLLYDVQPSIEYKLIARTGPSHRPTFTMSVEIHGQIFQGIGQTKREAKQAGKEKRSFSISIAFFS